MMTNSWRSVYRTVIPVRDVYVTSLPGFRRVVHVAKLRSTRHIPENLMHNLRNDLQLLEVWYEVDLTCSESSTLESEHEDTSVAFYIEGTGHPFDHDGQHAGTVIAGDGRLVWHVYVVSSSSSSTGADA